jgi:uncharacterized membrane protein
MIPIEKPRAIPPFPFLGPAVFVLTLYAIVAALLPPSPVRSVVAIAAFFAMGYASLALVVGGHIRLSSAEILAFTVGLTILITSLSALAVSIIGIPITEFAVIIIGLPIGVLTWLFRRSQGRPLPAIAGFIRRYLDFSDYSEGEKAVAAALLLAMTGAVAVLLTLAAIEYPDSLSASLAIAGPDGTPASLPTSFIVGQPQEVILTVLGNSSGGSFAVRIRLVPTNATGNESFHSASQTSPLRLDPFAEYTEPLTIGARGTWTRTYSIVMETFGSFNLRFELLDASSTVVARSSLPATVI